MLLVHGRKESVGQIGKQGIEAGVRAHDATASNHDVHSLHLKLNFSPQLLRRLSLCTKSVASRLGGTLALLLGRPGLRELKRERRNLLLEHKSARTLLLSLNSRLFLAVQDLLVPLPQSVNRVDHILQSRAGGRQVGL